MGRSAHFFGAVGLLAVLSAAPASGQLTSAQYTCQNTVATQSTKLFSKVFKELAKCQDKISAGDLPAATDCMLEPDAQAKIASAETRFQTKLQDKCDNSTVGSLAFGGACLAVTTVGDLVTCETQEHEQAAQAMIDLVYPRNVCVGGNNAGKVCSVNADCPPNPPEGTGVCSAVNVPPLSTDQQKCQKLLGKTVEKQAKKRLKTLQKCKRLVAKGKQGIETDCVATEQKKLSDLMAKSLAKIQSSCADSVTATLAFSGACRPQTSTDNVAACSLCVDDREADDLLLVQYGSSAYGKSASVQKVTDPNTECVKGPLSRCRADDYLLKNDKIRVVVQSIQRNLFGTGQFGGQIIDGDIVRAPLDPDRDNFEEWSTSLNIENTAHYTSLTVINDGSNGGAAILRATGVDDLLDFLNPSSAVAGFGLSTFPSSADDKDLPVTITTDYILEPGKSYVRVETTVHNTDTAPLKIFFGEFLNGSGQVETFQGGYAFGEPLVTSKCTSASPAPCDFVAYSGYDEADGVSYGYINEVPDTTTFTRDGVAIPQLGVDIAFTLIGLATQNFSFEPMGDPDGKDSLTFTRYFVVGNGSVGAITDTRNEIKCLPTGQLGGTVTADGSPAAGVDVTVLATAGNPSGLTYNAVTHARTDSSGKYAFTLPPGSYKVIANLDGSPFEGSLPTPTEHAVTVATFGTTTQNIALPATGALQVLVKDQDNQATAAKASVVGFDPSPQPLNKQSVLGLINNTTGLFGDLEDNLPFGVAQSIFIGKNGDTGVLPIEPGNYRVVVSHGPEYSISETDITVSASPAPEVANAKVEHVVDTSGFISGDFHVHSIQSADSAVKHTDRVLTMLAEGVDFFTPSEHDMRFDYQPTLTAMGVTNLISVAQSSEITTFDYGHFNAWPMTVDTNQENGGSVDFGRAAPDGQDFPSLGAYCLSPAEVIAAAHADPGASNTVQINHIHSHFSIEDGVGLAIDTGVSPPQSGILPLARRLDPALSNLFSDTFDALEIWIGADRGQNYDNFLGAQGGAARGGNIGDWFNLINQGIVRTGVADSDTHRRHLNQAGVPRSMVASPDDDPGSLGAIAETLSANVNDGRVVGTNGPMVRVEVVSASTGQLASLENGAPTSIATTDGSVDIEVDIQSPTWAPFDRVEYYINAMTEQRTVPGVQTGSQPPSTITLKRYKPCPDYVQTAGVDFTVSTVPVAGTGSSRLQASTSLSLAGLTQDTWVVVLVKGTDGVSKPMFPVVPNSLVAKACSNDRCRSCTTDGGCSAPGTCTVTNQTLAELTDGNLNECGITALAFTNPLFVDVDGGGWTPPGLQLGTCP